MEQLKNENFDLDRKVEITILQRENEKIENSINSYWKWKTFIFLVFLGALGGFTFGYFTNKSNFSWIRGEKIENYFLSSEIPLPIIQDYKNRNNISYYLDSEIDTIGLHKFSEKEIKLANDKIKKEISFIDVELESSQTIELIKFITIGMLLTTGYYTLIYVLIVFFGRINLNKNKIKLNEIGASELKENLNSEHQKDFFTQLVQINFKYLDQYYLQTQEQADKSFWLSAIASIIGFLMIIWGIFLMYNGKKIESGYVAASAGIFSEFIAAVFFYLYNRTILKMSQYHQKLVITQNISLALKTADLLKESKERVLENLIDRLTTDINKHLSNSNDG